MQDKELLELAAKAAGYIVDEHVSSGLWVYERNASWKGAEPPIFLWNPLIDDGDALRLSVKTGVGLVQHQGWLQTMHPSLQERVDVMYENNPYAATRRAIVRAAAEIGRLTKE